MGSFEFENSKIYMAKITYSVCNENISEFEWRKKIMLYIVILGLIVVPSHFRNVFHVKTVFFSVLNLKK